MADRTQQEESFGYRQLCREAILGFVFWSLFQTLAPMIWFYPLNAMEISGYEVFLLLLYSPCIMGIRPLRSLIQTRTGLGLFRIAALASLGSFQAPDTLTRLVVLATGCFMVMVVFTASLWSESAYQRRLTFWGLMLGLSAFWSSRVWLTSFVPTWWSHQSNAICIAIATLATVDKIASGEDGLKKSKQQGQQTTDNPRWLPVSIGAGSLLFLTQWIYGEVSVVTRWTVGPYPDTGPMPYPWGALVMVCLWLGFMVGSPGSGQGRLLLLWVLGVCALLALYYLHTWAAFTGGCILAVVTTSLWPVMAERLTTCPPARAMVVMVTTWIVLILHEIWTVAYNFVPGGTATREHTDHLIVLVMAGIALGLFAGRSPSPKSKAPEVKVGIGSMPKTVAVQLFLVILLLGLGGFVYRAPRQKVTSPVQVHPKADFSAAVWAYHFGYDNHGWPSMERASQLLMDTGADVIALLESDASKPFLGNHDLGQWLGEEMGVYVDFGPSTRDHTWGTLLLSKYPFVKSKHLLLPSPNGELAPAITATVNVTGLLVDVVATHMGNDWDDLDRRLQAKTLAQALKEAENPVVFLGYVTSKPYTRDYMTLIKDGDVEDIDPADRKRFCEYILYRGLIRLGYARVSHGGLSDTEVQMAKFRIPEDPDNYRNNEVVVTDPEDPRIDPAVSFNPKFGDFYPGHYMPWTHHYHMHTPKYFVSKQSPNTRNKGAS